MNGTMSERINGLKQRINNKGQGIVEFALLCAFCAAIGIFAHDVDFSGAFNETLDKSKPVLYAAEIGQRMECTCALPWRFLASWFTSRQYLAELLALK